MAPGLSRLRLALLSKNLVWSAVVEGVLISRLSNEAVQMQGVEQNKLPVERAISQRFMYGIDACYCELRFA